MNSRKTLEPRLGDYSVLCSRGTDYPVRDESRQFLHVSAAVQDESERMADGVCSGQLHRNIGAQLACYAAWTGTTDTQGFDIRSRYRFGISVSTASAVEIFDSMAGQELLRNHALLAAYGDGKRAVSTQFHRLRPDCPAHEQSALAGADYRGILGNAMELLVERLAAASLFPAVQAPPDRGHHCCIHCIGNTA